MARLLDLDRVDLEACRLADAWGWTDNGVVYRKPEPCPREHCGGSIILGFIGCMLCGRTRTGEPEWRPRRNGKHGPRNGSGTL